MQASENREERQTGDVSGGEPEAEFLQGLPTDDKVDRFLREGTGSAGKRTGQQWSPTTVLIVGLTLIAAATCGAVVRDAISLEMQQSKAEALMQKYGGGAPRISPFRP